MRIRKAMIIGCGDLGLRVARSLAADGVEVTGVVRTAHSAQSLTAAGIRAWRMDLDSPPLALPPDRVGVVFHFVPPTDAGDHDLRTSALLEILPPFPRLVYLSTTAVYGDRNGAWTDEATAPVPTSSRGRRRLDAERQVREWGERNGVEIIILRVAAIYGPGRLPLDRLREGAVAIRTEEAAPTNRIHVDDLAAICVAAATRGVPGEVYDCADGVPVTQAEYLETLAGLAGLPPPRLVHASEADVLLPISMLGFLKESKRIRARKIRDELGVVLRHPDHVAGLRASLAGA